MHTPGPSPHPSVNRLIHDLAARQHGVVGRTQLIEAGVTASCLDQRLKAGRLRLLHRGVYLVGPLLVPNARYMAAVLACGPVAAVSHRSAVSLWRFLPPLPEGTPIDVVVTRGRAGRRPGIHARHIETVHPSEISAVHGIPVTSPERTLLDFASVAAQRDLERALAEAMATGATRRARVLAQLDRHAGRPGARRLRDLLEGGTTPALTRSEAEERLLSLIRRARLPPPETNTPVAGFEVDFLWRRSRLVVEVDGSAFHSTGRRFESDRRRDAVLVAQGFRVMRVTWKQVVREPEAVLVRIAHALGPALGN